MPKTEKPEKFSALSGADVADLLGVTVKTVRNWMNSRLRLYRRAHPRSARSACPEPADSIGRNAAGRNIRITLIICP